jgi:hypothetical protein
MFNDDDCTAELLEAIERQAQTISLMAETLSELGFDLEDFLVAVSP